MTGFQSGPAKAEGENTHNHDKDSDDGPSQAGGIQRKGVEDRA